MHGGVEFDEVTVRGVAAALADSAGELARIADGLEVTLGTRFEGLGRAIRQWADQTACDADLLVATADGYAAQDAASAALIDRTDS